LIAPALWSPEMFLAIAAIVVFGSAGLVVYAAVMDTREEEPPPEEEEDAASLGVFSQDALTGLALEAAEGAREDIEEGAIEVWRTMCETAGVTGLPPAVATECDEDDPDCTELAAITDEELELVLERILEEQKANDFANWNSELQCCVDGLFYELESRGQDAAFFFEWIEENIGLEMIWRWYTTMGDINIATGCYGNQLIEQLGDWIEEKCPDWLCT